MNNKTVSAIAFFLLTTSLVSCSNSGEETANTANETVSAALPAPYDIQISIREIMSSLIDPHADALWNSVKVVSDSNGITEFAPETDEEWAALRISAVSIIEGSNSLMMPGRQVARPGSVGEFPEYEFTPEEVQELLNADLQSWVGFSQGLQNSAFDMLKAIDMRDSEFLSESGAYLDEACEACHANYWYREGL